MKYGDQLEFESVPQWSLHNLDYNSLKHLIKVHTTRDQATAMAIPGHQDSSLRKFEDRLFEELCSQHARVGLFVISKVDEISRRLSHLNRNIERWAGKLPADASARDSVMQQRRFNKYERELLRCGDDIQSLTRFASAQVVAFRKIVKKYRKWTGSTTLGSRFSHDVLSDPKSFTRRDWTTLQSQYDAVDARLRDATPDISEPSSPSTVGYDTSRPGTSSHLPPLPPPQIQDGLSSPQQGRTSPQRRRKAQDMLSNAPTTKYWNEYDNGSETGGEDNYAIYVNPDEETSFPGFTYVQSAWTGSIGKARRWIGLSDSNPEHRPLLTAANAVRGYSSTSTDSEEEGYASSQELPRQGYSTYYAALPSVGEQKINRYRENTLFWATIGGFIGSFILLAVSGVIITTGRHKLRIEVDAAATVGVAMSLFCACAALGTTLYRRDELSLSYKIMVGATFIASCLLNGMLLILVVGNAP